MAITLIGGGAGSGKSRYAFELARQRGTRLALIATADAVDDETRERIEAHRIVPGFEFATIEAPLELSGVVSWQSSRCDAIVVDCLTAWLADLIRAKRSVEPEVERLLAAARQSEADVLLVTSEVGCGIAPESEAARRFRSLAGRLNQQSAGAADEVHWMVFGCPLKVK